MHYINTIFLNGDVTIYRDTMNANLLLEDKSLEKFKDAAGNQSNFLSQNLDEGLYEHVMIMHMHNDHRYLRSFLEWEFELKMSRNLKRCFNINLEKVNFL